MRGRWVPSHWIGVGGWGRTWASAAAHGAGRRIGEEEQGQSHGRHAGPSSRRRRRSTCALRRHEGARAGQRRDWATHKQAGRGGRSWAARARWRGAGREDDGPRMHGGLRESGTRGRRGGGPHALGRTR
jgi:hypothetical protein